jgi:hypothetical protein
VLPLEYRALVLGPLLVGTYGYTPHSLVDFRAAGVWYAALPRAPAAARPGDAVAAMRAGAAAHFAGVAVAADHASRARVRGAYAHMKAATPATASLRQLGNGPRDAREADCGRVAACGLAVAAAGPRAVTVRNDRTQFDLPLVATLTVACDGAPGGVARVPLTGSCHDCDGARRWHLAGPDWTANAPPPAAARAARGALGFCGRARDADTFAWPADADPAACDSLTLEGDFVSGVLVLEAAAANRGRGVDVAVFALAPAAAAGDPAP